MTAPNQPYSAVTSSSPYVGAIEDVLGVGAYQIGGGGENYGQDLTTSAVDTIAKGFSIDPTNVIGSLEGLLRELPLEALQLFEQVIPGLSTVVKDFSSEEAAIESILNTVTSLLSTLEGDIVTGAEWLANTFLPLVTLVNSLFAPFTSLLGGTGTGGDAVTSGLTNLLGAFGGSTTLTEVESFLSTLPGDFSALVEPFETLLGGTGGGASSITSGLNNLFAIFGAATSLSGADTVLSGLNGSGQFDVTKLLGTLTQGQVSGLPTLNTMVNQITGIVNGDVVTPINSAITEFQSWWSGIMSTVSGNTTGISTNSSAISQIGQIVGGTTVGSPVNTAVSAFQNWWNVLTSTVSGHTTSIGTNNTMLQQITDIVNGALVTPLNTEVTNFQNWWNSITGSVSGNSSSIGSLNTTVASHASSISTLTTNHNNLLTALFGSTSIGSSVLPGITQVSIGGVVDTLENHIQNMVDQMFQANNGSTATGVAISTIKPGLTAIPATNVVGLAAAGVNWGASGVGLQAASSTSAQGNTLSGSFGLAPAAADTAILVGVTMEGLSTSPAQQSPSVKFGTTAMTEVAYNGATGLGSFGSTYFTEGFFFWLKIPAGSASQNITVSLTGSGCNVQALCAQAMSFNAASVGSPGYVTGTGTAMSQTLTGSSATHRVVQMFYGQRSSLAGQSAFSAYSQSNPWYGVANGNSGLGTAMVMGDAVGASSVSFTATAAAASYWGGIVIDLAN